MVCFLETSRPVLSDTASSSKAIPLHISQIVLSTGNQTFSIWTFEVQSHSNHNNVCAPHVFLTPSEVKRGHQIPCSWSYKWLWTTRIGNLLDSLQEQQILYCLTISQLCKITISKFGSAYSLFLLYKIKISINKIVQVITILILLGEQMKTASSVSLSNSGGPQWSLDTLNQFLCFVVMLLHSFSFL